MRADPHVRYRRDNNEKKKRMIFPLSSVQDSSTDPFFTRIVSLEVNLMVS